MKTWTAEGGEGVSDRETHTEHTHTQRDQTHFIYGQENQQNKTILKASDLDPIVWHMHKTDLFIRFSYGWAVDIFC